MLVPDGFNYGAIAEEGNLKEWLKDVVRDIEVDGYVTINKILRFKDIDIACMDIRGKDPILSPLKKCKVDTRILSQLYSIISDKVSCNFEVRDNSLFLPDIVCVENFNFIAPREGLNPGNNISSMPTTPLEVIWRLIRDNYSIIVDGCAPVPCHKIYFGYNNFSINVDYVDMANIKQTITLMKLENGMYRYTPFNIIDTRIGIKDDDVDYVLNACDKVDVHDDIGRTRQASRINLKLYEKYVYNQRRLKKLYDKNFTLTVLSRMYKTTAYLDGIGLILNEMGVACQRFSIPHRAQQTFSLNTDKQHNNFSIQMMGYDPDIVNQVLTVYKMHKDLLTEYLKTKDEKLREEIQIIFSRECSDKFGQILHYYVNGILDALAIQKGDMTIRTKILKGYYDTVHKEFLMYGCYYYDIRTAFLRNNCIIDREFQSEFVCNEFNGQYFLVG